MVKLIINVKARICAVKYNLRIFQGWVIHDFSVFSENKDGYEYLCKS